MSTSKIESISPLGLSPAELVRRLRLVGSDAVVIGAVKQDHRTELQQIAEEIAVLVALRKDVPKRERHRGEQYVKTDHAWSGLGRLAPRTVT